MKLLDRLFKAKPITDEEFNKKAKVAFLEALSKADDDGKKLDEFTYKMSGFGWSKSRTWTYRG